MQASSQSEQPSIRHPRRLGNGRNASRPPVTQDDEAEPWSGGPGALQTLLADDNELFRDFLRDVLVRHFPFMLIAEAGDGDHALALDAELHPQLVFMDITLPDRSGLDLTRQFKSSNPGVLVYLVTQHDIPEYRIAAQECGADQLIVKGESNEAAIVAMLESTLPCRLRRTSPGDEKSLIAEECVTDLPG